jgi:hypothetical protein
MPELRKEILQGRLRKEDRFGHTIWLNLPIRTAAALHKLKAETRRTLRAICMMILKVFAARRDSFRLDPPAGPYARVNFRISNIDAKITSKWAWELRVSREALLGNIIHEFLQKVPIGYIEKTLKNFDDVTLHLEEEAHDGGDTEDRRVQHTGPGDHGDPCKPHRDHEGHGSPARRRTA